MISIKMHKRRVKTGMSPVAEVLLAMVIVESEKGITIMGLLDHAIDNQLSSPATNHRALDWLRANKFVKTVSIDGNQRTKYLAPTKKGLSYFKGL
jgi:Fe2+ or Zn2+ uptake regulation protein